MNSVARKVQRQKTIDIRKNWYGKKNIEQDIAGEFLYGIFFPMKTNSGFAADPIEEMANLVKMSIFDCDSCLTEKEKLNLIFKIIKLSIRTI
jgi:hypothetical protein